MNYKYHVIVMYKKQNKRLLLAVKFLGFFFFWDIVIDTKYIASRIL